MLLWVVQGGHYIQGRPYIYLLMDIWYFRGIKLIQIH